VRIAVAGKGGSGKTTVSGTLARAFGRAGVPVLALDADTNPLLGISLGLGPETTDGLVAAHQALTAAEGDLDPGSPADAIVRAHGTDAPDDVRLLVVSRIDRFDPG